MVELFDCYVTKSNQAISHRLFCHSPDNYRSAFDNLITIGSIEQPTPVILI